MKKVFLGLALAALMCLSTNTSFTTERQPVLIGIVGRSCLNWPVYIIFEKGLIARDIEPVKLIVFRDENRAISALASGSVNVLGVIGTEILIQNQLRGAPIDIVGGVVKVAPHYLLISPEIKEIVQLKGKNVGVPNFHETASIYFMNTYLKEKGLYFPEDYRIVNLGKEEYAFGSVKYGKTSAALVPIGTDLRNIGKRFSKISIITLPDYQSKVVAMNRDWARRHKTQSIEIMHGLIQAIKWLHDDRNREEAVKILVKYTKNKTDVVKGVYEAFIKERKMFSVDTPRDNKRIDAVLEAMIKMGRLKQGDYNCSKFSNEFMELRQ